MPRSIIAPVGTSQLDPRKLEKLGLRPNPADVKRWCAAAAHEYPSWLLDTPDGSLAAIKGSHAAGSLGDLARDVVSRLMTRCLPGSLDDSSEFGSVNPFGAELTSLFLCFIQPEGTRSDGTTVPALDRASDPVHLLASDTVEGVLGAIVVWNLLVLHTDLSVKSVDARRVPHLTDDHPEHFAGEGLPNLEKMVGDLRGDGRTIVNVTGGFKAAAMQLGIWAADLGAECWYQFEDSRYLVRIRPRRTPEEPRVVTEVSDPYGPDDCELE